MGISIISGWGKQYDNWDIRNAAAPQPSANPLIWMNIVHWAWTSQHFSTQPRQEIAPILCGGRQTQPQPHLSPNSALKTASCCSDIVSPSSLRPGRLSPRPGVARLGQVRTNGLSYTYWISRIYYSYTVQFKFSLKMSPSFIRSNNINKCRMSYT